MRLFSVDEWHEIIYTCCTDFEHCEVKAERFTVTRKEDEDEDEDEGSVGRLAMYVQLATGWRDIMDTDTGKGWTGLVSPPGSLCKGGYECLCACPCACACVFSCFLCACMSVTLCLSTLRLLSKAHWGMVYGSIFLHVYW